MKQKVASALVFSKDRLFEKKSFQMLSLKFISFLQSYLDQFQAISVLTRDIESEMCYEIGRLMSFSGTPCPASPIRLAESEFYSVGNGQQTRCYSCGALYGDWQMMDRPAVIHRLISPDCLHLTLGDDRNIAINTEPNTNYANIVYGVIEDYTIVRDAPGSIAAPFSALSIQDDNSTVELSNMDISQAIYPQYRDIESRLGSYQGWGWSHLQDPQVLAAAGFYYAGNSNVYISKTTPGYPPDDYPSIAGYRDCVRCFYCGVGLRTWEREDDPWVEHVRWRSSCDYVRSLKGEQFVILTLAGPNQHSFESSASLPTSSTRQIQQNTDENSISIKLQSVAPQGMSTATHQGRQSMPPETQATPSEISQEPSQDPTFASSLTGISRAREAKEVIHAETEHVNSSGTKEKILVVEDSNNASANPANQNNADTQLLSLQRQLEGENQSLGDESTCKVCLDNPSCIVFLPCGHLVTCAECAPALRKCPVCRSLIRGTVRAYSE